MNYFDSYFESSNAAPVLIFNIPDITSFPVFTQGHRNIYLQNDQLTAFWMDFNLQVREWNFLQSPPTETSDYRSIIDFDPLSQLTNYYVIEDRSLPTAIPAGEVEIPKYRQMTMFESVNFHLNGQLSEYGLGTTIPISDQFSLTNSEITIIKNWVNDVNAVFDRLDFLYEDVHVIDLKTYYLEILDKIEIDEGLLDTGEVVDNTILAKGIFSSDGINFNQRGNAIMVNHILSEIERELNVKLGRVDVQDFPGNTFEVL